MSASRAKSRNRQTPAAETVVEVPAGSPALPWMLLLFVGSGCAALIYEIVWFQLLTLSVGSSAVSLAVVLGTFMGGMCLGSLLLPRFISRAHHPLRIYALLEAGIGVLGLIILFALPYAGGLYTAIGGPGMRGLLLRGLISALVLFPPTLLMGATLPAIARYVEATPRGVSWLGFFYGGNIAGGVFGCLLAGYYLLRVHDTAFATYVAVALNALVSTAGFTLARLTSYTPRVDAQVAADTPRERGWWPVYIAIALSGMTALGAEVVWTRLLSLTLGATTYTFSLILAVFLIGLGIGSSAGSLLARSVRDPRFALGICQLLLTAGIAWAALLLARALPYWPVNPGLAPSPWFTFQVDFDRAFWTVLPGAILWGASFPLALAGVRREADPGRLVGTVYAANTVGAIIGAVIASLLMIAWLGTQQAQRVLIAIAGISAALMLVPTFASADGGVRVQGRGIAFAVITLIATFGFAKSVAKIPPMLVAYGRYTVTWLQQPREFLFVGEGMNSSMAVTRQPDGVLNYHNAGKVQASSMSQDMRLQRMLGHLATLVPENPRSVLVIGCGAGVTAGSVSIDPGVEREVIAEIEPLVPNVVAKTYFAEQNFGVISNPKVHVQIDDARHYLLTTHDKFDAITSDPFDPWVKGAATLYTKEFFQVMRQHLNPDGVVTIFVQLYESGMAAVKSEVATFLEVFPNGVVFGNPHQGGGYDVVLLGQVSDKPIDVDRIQRKLERPEYAPVLASMNEIGFTSAVDLFGRYAAQGPMLRPWLADAQVNRDRNLRLQYLAGLGINAYEQARIYSEMLSYRQWPNNLFSGSEQTMNALRFAVANNQ